jgi:hypothetical protein
MKSTRCFLAVLAGSLVWAALAAPVALGQPDSRGGPSHSRKVFDNGNTAACEMTDTAAFRLENPVRVDRIELWYRWHHREESVSYTISRHGKTLRSGVLTRGDCDPYQENWCNAVDRFDLRLDEGKYVVRTERPRVCQNAGSDGNGVVRVYGSHH